jgi:hypothetical protein
MLRTTSIALATALLAGSAAPDMAEAQSRYRGSGVNVPRSSAFQGRAMRAGQIQRPRLADPKRYIGGPGGIGLARRGFGIPLFRSF